MRKQPKKLGMIVGSLKTTAILWATYLLHTHTYTTLHYHESNSFQTESSKRKCYPLWCLIVLTPDVFRCETTALIAHPSNL